MEEHRPCEAQIAEGEISASTSARSVPIEATSLTVTPDFLKQLAESIETNQKLLAALLEQRNSRSLATVDYYQTAHESVQKANNQTLDNTDAVSGEQCNSMRQETPVAGPEETAGSAQPQPQATPDEEQHQQLPESSASAGQGKMKNSKQSEQTDKAEAEQIPRTSLQASAGGKRPRKPPLAANRPNNCKKSLLKACATGALQAKQTRDEDARLEPIEEIICPEYVRQLETVPRFAKLVRNPKQLQELLADVNLKHLPPNCTPLSVWYKRLLDDVYVKERVISFHKSIGMVYFCLESDTVLRFPRISSEKV